MSILAFMKRLLKYTKTYLIIFFVQLGLKLLHQNDLHGGTLPFIDNLNQLIKDEWLYLNPISCMVVYWGCKEFVNSVKSLFRKESPKSNPQ